MHRYELVEQLRKHFSLDESQATKVADSLGSHMSDIERVLDKIRLRDVDGTPFCHFTLRYGTHSVRSFMNATPPSA